MDIREVLSGFARAAVPTPSEGAPTPDALGRACIEVSGAAGCAITVEFAGEERMTLFASDETSAHLEDLQEILGEGPGWDALRTSEATSASVQDARWPLLATASDDIGDVWVAAATIHAGGDSVGVLTLHWAGSRPPDDTAELVSLLADLVGMMFARTSPEDWDVRLPWTHRDRIHQATGMLVARMRLTVEDAMAVLRSYAFSTETDLHDAATQVLEGRAALGLRLDDGSSR